MILNKKGEELNVIHFNGKCINSYKKLSEYCMSTRLDASQIEGVTLISCWTDESKCILKKQCDKNGITLVNSYIPNGKPWTNPYKIDCYCDAIRSSENDIIMLLDGNDVLFSSFNGLLDKFKKCGYRILFNAGSYMYPLIRVEEVKPEWGPFGYLNAGCCIGYKEDLLKFYTECLHIKDKVKNPWKSEQLIVRNVYKNYNTKKDNDFVFIDNKLTIFQKMLYMNVVENGENFIVTNERKPKRINVNEVIQRKVNENTIMSKKRTKRTKGKKLHDAQCNYMWQNL